MPFFLDGNPTQGEISEAVNYLLGNFSQNVTADPATGQITGPTGEVSGYLYKYMHIKYSDSFDGTLNFSNVPTNHAYYGLRNSDSSSESTNPSDYVWYQVAGGFGTTKFLYYLTTGGRQIQFSISTSTPNPGWIQDNGTAIDLDVTAATDSVANFVVIRIPNNSAAPTDAECIANIGRTPISGDLCTVNYNSGIYSIVYKYTTGWAVFQKYITGDLIVAHTITANELYSSYVQVGGAASDVNSGVTTINGGKITANSITVNEINNVATGQIIAGSFNFVPYTSSGTWTCPAYVYKAKITVIGGGAGGTNYNAGIPGGGGGSGGGAISVITVVPGVVYTVTVGNGGGAGSNGSASSFSGSGITTITANGGSTATGGWVGGAGGTASGGNLNITGSGGGNGDGTGTNSYAGGYGGGAPFVGANAKAAASGSANSGSGGGGGIAGSTTGGSGGSGLVIIEY